MGTQPIATQAPTPAATPGSVPVRLQRCGDHPCPPTGCDRDDDAELHRSATGTGPAQVPGSVTSVLRSPGTPLSPGLRARMEQRLGHGFDWVRVHTDPAAAATARDVHARAYTVGPHIVFAAGRYQPGTGPGERLLTHELAHVVQQRGQHWSPGQLRISRPHDPDEVEADRVAGGSATTATPTIAGGPVLHRVWEATGSAHCTGRPADPWLRKVVVDQEKAQSVTLHWSDGTVTASICSTGKGHCCVDSSKPDATAASVAESRRNGSNATPIGSFFITDNYEVYNGWKFWNTFLGNRGIALHQHHTVTGTPLSHGCVRLPEDTAKAIFCGARQRQTQVDVRGFARPDCEEPELQQEWRSDFRTAGRVTDGEEPSVARTIASNRREARRMLKEAYGRELSEAEIAQGQLGTLDIPRCGFTGAEPDTEATRALPETGAGANVPSTSSEVLAASGLERFVPALAGALDTAPSFAAARSAADRIGRELWTAATGAAAAGRGDDRPLYWARVQMRRAIHQWQPRFRLTTAQRDELVEAFEQASRGMRTARFTGPARQKRIVISGFDPFGFELQHYGLTRASNPSGAAALALDGRTLTNGGVTGAVESVVFPVSFAAFDAGTVERFFRPYLRGARPADMIMTISMGSSRDFEVEEFAGRSRQAGFPDNPGVTPARAGAPPGIAAGPEFIRGTLPSSARGALGRTKPLPAETEVVEIPAGKTRPERRPTGPTPGSTAVEGSGGGYLSNDIFYRVGLLQRGEGTAIPFGHLHVPFLSPDTPGFAGQRDRIVRQVEQILTAVLPDL